MEVIMNCNRFDVVIGPSRVFPNQLEFFTTKAVGIRRHIHEFVCMGSCPEFLDSPEGSQLTWLDLVQGKSPALFVNSSNTDANALFHFDVQTGAVLETIGEIPKFTEILVSYMDEVVQE